ncbi:hypothetical protein HK100_007909 [Physocladia obscura]|uniref:Uncharacterized protein n=1 Tax=Physocladia obscura TaxID=109957 RepID=A0AAD5SNE0_9FUNG|nr:hypothetical protein HK100_007909 [Physocladia obscura]
MSTVSDASSSWHSDDDDHETMSTLSETMDSNGHHRYGNRRFSDWSESEPASPPIEWTKSIATPQQQHLQSPAIILTLPALLLPQSSAGSTTASTTAAGTSSPITPAASFAYDKELPPIIEKPLPKIPYYHHTATALTIGKRGSTLTTKTTTTTTTARSGGGAGSKAVAAENGWSNNINSGRNTATKSFRTRSAPAFGDDDDLEKELIDAKMMAAAAATTRMRTMSMTVKQIDGKKNVEEKWWLKIFRFGSFRPK